MKKKLIAVPAAALMMLGLAACGGNDGAQSFQSVEAACHVVDQQMKLIGDNYSDAASEEEQDPDKAVETLNSMTKELEAAAPLITNKNVRAAWDTMVTAYSKLAAAAAKEDQSGAAEAISGLQQSAQEMQSLCGEYLGSPQS